jgi:hypothetical protein
MLPAVTTWIGGAVIIATGIYTAHRERIRARERMAEDRRRNPIPKGIGAVA